jgi:hypothetical protein
MGSMSSAVKWWTRLTAALTGAVLTLVVPVHAWAASTGTGALTVEAVRYRRRSRIGFVPIFGGVCCLLVVAAVVLAFVLIRRNRSRK